MSTEEVGGKLPAKECWGEQVIPLSCAQAVVRFSYSEGHLKMYRVVRLMAHSKEQAGIAYVVKSSRHLYVYGNSLYEQWLWVSVCC